MKIEIMKIKQVLFMFLVGYTPSAFSQWIVNDPPLTQVSMEQLLNLQQVLVQLRTTEQTLIRIEREIGLARPAVRRLEDESTFITNVGRMAAPDKSVDVVAAKVNVSSAMQTSGSPYRKEAGGSMRVFNKTLQRSSSLYEENLRQEAAARSLRSLAEVNRAHQHEFSSRLAGANDRFEESQDLVSVLASVVDVARLSALILSADAVNENAKRDFEFRRLLEELAREEARTRHAELVAARSKASRDASAKADATFGKTILGELARGRSESRNLERMAVRKQGEADF